MKAIYQSSVLAFLSLMAVSTTTTLAATSADPTTEPLVQLSDLAYVGAFRLPEGATNQLSFDDAGDGLAYDATDNSLFITGHTWYQLTAEVSIPSPIASPAISSLPTATFIQPFTDALDGKLSTINPTDPNNKDIGGYLVYNGQLIISAYSSYDGSGTQYASHFTRSTTLTGGTVAGPFRVGNQYPGFVSAYMSLVPSEWQAALGGPALTGNCCLSIIGEQSNGPAVSVFDPATLGSESPVPATPLVGYPSSNPLGNAWNAQSSLFNGTTTITGVVFPDGTRSVLFFGRQGLGKFCYGPGTATQSLVGTAADSGGDPWCYDPVDSDKGTHAYPYVYQIWAYDADDLLKVKNGEEPEYSVKPYAVWQLSLPYAGGTDLIGGVAYDPSSSKIYISQLCVDAGCSPIIEVFKITNSSSTGATSSPSSPTNVIVK